MFNDLVDVVRDLHHDKDEVPNLELPEPEKVQIEEGSLYVFRFPEGIGRTQGDCTTVAVPRQRGGGYDDARARAAAYGRDAAGLRRHPRGASRPMAIARRLRLGRPGRHGPSVDRVGNRAEAWPAREADDEKEADSEGKK